MMKQLDKRQITGWIAVGLSTAITCFWAFWGIIENFHEGWYYESPLWNTHSQVIYWWTGTEIDVDHAYIIVYDGRVWPRAKRFDLGYLGFRCVK